jgi:hypothetical protein
LRGPAST